MAEVGQKLTKSHMELYHQVYKQSPSLWGNKQSPSLWGSVYGQNGNSTERPQLVYPSLTSEGKTLQDAIIKQLV